MRHNIGSWKMGAQWARPPSFMWALRCVIRGRAETLTLSAENAAPSACPSRSQRSRPRKYCLSFVLLPSSFAPIPPPSPASPLLALLRLARRLLFPARSLLLFATPPRGWSDQKILTSSFHFLCAVVPSAPMCTVLYSFPRTAVLRVGPCYLFRATVVWY
eukprot:RCo047850